MGIFDKLLKKKKAEELFEAEDTNVDVDSDDDIDEDTEQEVSPGGSTIYKHDEVKDEGWRAPQAYGVFAEEINEYFSKVFPDREEFVFHEIISDLVHIDVNIMRPNETAPYYFVYTTGMSDLPMHVPTEIEDRDKYLYGELFMMMPDTWNPGSTGELSEDIPDSEYWPIDLIKYFARFPHEYHTWLGWGHTIPNGPEYSPLCEGSDMGGIILTQLGGDLEALTASSGERINFYMIVPAYKEEIEFKLEHGMDALDDIFAEKNLPMIIDINRGNYCIDK